MNFWKRHKKADLIRAYKNTFSSEEGKAVLHDLMRTFHVLNSTMDSSTNEVMFKEGERSVILRILRTINTDANELEKILNEQDNK